MLQGKQSWRFEPPPVVLGYASVVGPEEGKGPLASDFDQVHDDLRLGQKSWELAEQQFLERAVNRAIEKSGADKSRIDFYVGGDLMNQITSTSFVARTVGIPYLGVFGACSTAMESAAVAAQLVSTGAANLAIAATGSHNCTAEKQFRYPTEYGSQKPPTAQFTVTGGGAAVIGAAGKGPKVMRATIGKIIDMGIKNPFNMGAAMAPAAVDTIAQHLEDFALEPSYYDLIVTGDLAQIGHSLARDLFAERQIPIDQTVFSDCGLLIFDRERQQVQAGGSGCGCCATVTYGHLFNRMSRGELKRVLVVATGALLSPLSYQQGESIPCVAHAVAFEAEGGER
ncbi:stage V sporulation protein AD [Gorillibacterium timonense]|uniref:stage V sporulation protein AD n=1 Tax=Gorillibacterium timonense TaxID=1689269 RepID=UPI00071C50FA|nr:stage V sporulation protein AD [Gorillibacterium timonense]